MQLSSEAVNVQSISQELQVHKQIQRLKKLVYYTSTGNWENDTNVLEQLSLDTLLEQLYQTNSSLEDLSSALYQSVESLNRQTVYSELANLIIAKLGPLYQDSGDSTEVIMIKPSVRDSITEDTIKVIIARLNKNPEIARIKKLVFYISKDYWENDLNVIDSYDFKELILKIRETYTSFFDLEKAFNDLVATLNRQHVYQGVAQAITQELVKLYKSDEGETALFDKTGLVTEIKPKETEATCVIPSQEIGIISQEKEIVPQVEAKKPEADFSNKLTTYTPFDWRLDIMQYTNPLRVKILMFSLLYHQFQNNERDWSKLKSCTMEELLNKILNRYESISQIETQLNSVCKESSDSELYQQIAAVIIKSFMSFYDNI